MKRSRYVIARNLKSFNDRWSNSPKLIALRQWAFSCQLEATLL